jgi:hypothetical protein
MTIIQIRGNCDGSEADRRHSEILDALAELHPESKKLIDELSDLFGVLANEALEEGGRRQGLLIRAVLDGTFGLSDEGDVVVWGGPGTHVAIG